MKVQTIEGFSKLSKLEKIEFLVEKYLGKSQIKKETFKSFWVKNEKEQQLFDEFSENTISNFLFPYGVVPNVLINDEIFCVPMVIEESSVVAAASKAAKFWLTRGGFKTTILGLEKVGQVHMIWNGKSENIFKLFAQTKKELLEEMAPLEANMKKRGGGIIDIALHDKTDLEPGLFQLYVTFNTCDAMGANFINTILEALGKSFKYKVDTNELTNEHELMVVMSILSNYTPNCLVRAEVSCPVKDLEDPGHGMTPEMFAEKFQRALRIAHIDPHRATTHNKGIMNGIDAVVLATGNDFRAIEACAHTYASRSGKYASLTSASVENGFFKFWLEIPLALGTVGGLTALHPMARLSLEMLQNPSASKLMEITAVIGLAQNFGAVRSLVTSGIQKGHMKMHLMNILKHFEASEHEVEKAKTYFENEVISFKAVRDFLASERNLQ